MKLINYPAMASPVSVNIIRDHLKKWVLPGSKVLDPFCGTSRLLFQPRQYGCDITGVDCSPIAVLTSRVAHQRTELKSLTRDLTKIMNCLDERMNYSPNEEELFWFESSSFKELKSLLSSIDANSSSRISQRFFWLCLVMTARKVSYIRETEYKNHRIRAEERASYRPDATAAFLSCFRDLNNRLSQIVFSGRAGKYRFLQGDVYDVKLPHSKYDVLVSSPPYGDSISTVGYGQYARTALLLLTHSEDFRKEYSTDFLKKSLDSLCLGGSLCDTPSAVKLPHCINYIEKGPMRKFSEDYFSRLNIVSERLNSSATCCFVLGDRTYKRRSFPLVESTIQHMQGLGFQLIERHDRYLGRKCLPRTMQLSGPVRNSKHSGMNYESVVIFRR